MATQQKYQPGDKAIVTGMDPKDYIHYFEIGQPVQVMYGIGGGEIYKCISDKGLIQAVSEYHLSPITPTT